jgi:hypothetical protein
MPRQKGSKNKPKNMLDVNVDMDSEDIFLAEMIRAKAFWSQRAKEMDKKGHNNELELAYAEFYKLGINQFTVIEKPNK